MICVEWKGKPGYGDLTSPCSYVNNLSEKTGEKVRLEWVSFNDVGVKDKYEKDASEDLIYRLHTIFVMLRTADVELKTTFAKNLPYQHSKLPNHPFHNYKSVNEWRGGSGYVTFVTTENNKIQFKDYPEPEHKLWKDPTNNNWEPLYSQFDKVNFVDYDTPIDKAIDILTETELLITYDGSASSLGRALGTPTYILSGRPEHTLSDFPNAIISKKMDFTPDEIFDIQEICLEKIEDAEQGRLDYVNNYIG